jgi:hypothetical protein
VRTNTCPLFLIGSAFPPVFPVIVRLGCAPNPVRFLPAVDGSVVGDGAVVAQQDLPLSAPVPSGTVVINARCMVRAEGEHRVVIVAGLLVHHYSVKDAVAEAYAMVLLVDGGYTTQKEVAVAFGTSDRPVRRHQGRYADGGMTGLASVLTPAA